MLVALSLLSLLTILLTGQIRFGLRAWETGAAVADDLAELQTVQVFLRHQLTLAQTLQSDAEEDEGIDARQKRPIFTGEPGHLRLAVAGAPRFGPAPYNIIELSQGRLSGKGQLNLKWRPFYPVTKASPGVKARRRVLLSGVKKLRFSYFGTIDPRDKDAPARWHDRWGDQTDLPRLIRIELDFDDAGRYWPELTIALPTARERRFNSR